MSEATGGELLQFLRSYWMKQIERGDSFDVEGAIRSILSDECMTRAAVRNAVVAISRKEIDRNIRAAQLGNNVRVSPLVDAIIAHGLSLLDTKFGARKLGDYSPESLLVYAEQQGRFGKTVLVQASFAKAIAKACHDETAKVRDQLTNEQVLAIRDNIISRVPDRRFAESVLSVA